ncbi:MAG: ABC-2 transporter permease, partial [Defluviitaleaceae bacterium]|nr:ABC-2 transporter permease [Defluviitaleaceae bacterium]
FKISMPIRRRDMIFASYFNIFFASLMGLPIVAVVWAIGIVDVNVLLLGFSYGVVFVVPALAYVLSCTKLNKIGDTGLLLTCMLAGTAIVAAMSVAGNALEVSAGVVALSIVAITLAMFVISMFITAKLYEKIDF